MTLQREPCQAGPADVVYCGTVSKHGVVHVYANGQRLDPRPSQRIHNHSPDGFQWGYGGSGPAQLALALLLDATSGNAETAQDMYQDYKFDVVAGWEKTGWVTTRSAILGWIADQYARLDVARRQVEGGES